MADAYDTRVLRVEPVIVSRDKDGNLVEAVLDLPSRPGQGPVNRIELDTRL